MEDEWTEYTGAEEDEWTFYTGEEEFHDRADVRRVRVAPHVTAIPERAFDLCQGLREVDLANVTEIGNRAFMKCNELREVDLSNVTEIRNRAFYGCTRLFKITLRCVKTIGPLAFGGCSKLAAVELTEGLRTISTGAFMGCTELKSVAIPSTVAEIRTSAFDSCTKLGAVTLCDGLRVIGHGAFESCVKLESIVIPSTVTEIRREAFRFCTKLASVEILGGVQTIGQSAFHDRDLERINIPSPAFVFCDDLGATLRYHLSRDTTISRRIRMIESKFVKYMSPARLEEAVRKVNDFVSRQMGRGNYGDRIRYEPIFEGVIKLFAYYGLVDVTTILELAIWKAKIDESTQNGRRCVEKRGQRREMDDSISHRIQCRTDSGAHVIVPLVIPYI